jgi:endonuclease/exonuclease/phosphatase family metal-dependent hydrolase
MVIGDFNNNAIWDGRSAYNFSDLNRRLGDLGLCSVYHARSGERPGEESIPTHFWRDRAGGSQAYHIDYIFLRRHLLDAVEGFEAGRHEDWCGNGLSDHAPLVLDIRESALSDAGPREPTPAATA